MSIVFGIIGGLIIWAIVSYSLDYNLTQKEIKYKTIPIYSLKNDTQIQGNFTLGTGSLYETEYYYFYIKNSRGNFERGEVPVRHAEINETDNKQPAVLIPYVIKTIRKDNLKHPKLWYFNTQNTSKTSETYTDKRILRVPKGTIIKKFSVY